jgi:uroporphyrin-3 C-methyltransferase
MSNVDKPNQSAAPEGARVPAAAVQPRATRSRSGSLVLALLLALFALAAAGFVGWRQWQQQRRVTTVLLGASDMRTRVAALESAAAGERAGIEQRLGDAAAVNRSLRDELLAQADRTRHLEDAVAQLAEKNLSGHDAMLLDETESLLRMASERYTLFHDAQGAAAAYALADQTLAAVDDAAFGGVRQAIASERAALAKSQPASQAEALQQLAQLRGELATLPLKPLDSLGSAGGTDAWSRIGRVLATVISVQHDNGAPLAVADARLARELTALDLAQAQAALLASDSGAYAAALQQVTLALSTQFDAASPAVQQAQASLKQLAAALPSAAPVPLGAALGELRNLRAVHALKPVADHPPTAAAAPVAGTKS